jgi:hypothetical protein
MPTAVTLAPTTAHQRRAATRARWARRHGRVLSQRRVTARASTVWTTRRPGAAQRDVSAHAPLLVRRVATTVAMGRSPGPVASALVRPRCDRRWIFACHLRAARLRKPDMCASDRHALCTCTDSGLLAAVLHCNVWRRGLPATCLSPVRAADGLSGRTRARLHDRPRLYARRAGCRMYAR